MCLNNIHRIHFAYLLLRVCICILPIFCSQCFHAHWLCLSKPVHKQKCGEFKPTLFFLRNYFDFGLGLRRWIRRQSSCREHSSCIYCLTISSKLKACFKADHAGFDSFSSTFSRIEEQYNNNKKTLKNRTIAQSMRGGNERTFCSYTKWQLRWLFKSWWPFFNWIFNGWINVVWWPSIHVDYFVPILNRGDWCLFIMQIFIHRHTRTHSANILIDCPFGMYCGWNTLNKKDMG